jgi:hypothetical protein
MAKPPKRVQDKPFMVRMRQERYDFMVAALEHASQGIESTEVRRVALGPWLVELGTRRAEQLLGVSFAEWEQRQGQSPAPQAPAAPRKPRGK